jgi:hypothetical protein
MNVYTEVEVLPHVFLTSALARRGDFHTPAALPQGKNPPVPIE